MNQNDCYHDIMIFYMEYTESELFCIDKIDRCKQRMTISCYQ